MVYKKKKNIKTKMCVFNILSACKKGETCRFAHSEEELQAQPAILQLQAQPVILPWTKLCPSLPSYLVEAGMTGELVEGMDAKGIEATEVAGHGAEADIGRAAGPEGNGTLRGPSAGGGRLGRAVGGSARAPTAPSGEGAGGPRKRAVSESASRAVQFLAPLAGARRSASAPKPRAAVPSGPAAVLSFAAVPPPPCPPSGPPGHGPGRDLGRSGSKQRSVKTKTVGLQASGVRTAGLPESERPQNNLLHKTRMCAYNAIGRCLKSGDCTFAHSEEELLPAPNFHRTKLCPAMLASGKCQQAELPGDCTSLGCWSPTFTEYTALANLH